MAVAEPTPRLEMISWTWIQGKCRRLVGLVPSIIGLHLCLTLFLAARLNLWIDEAYSLATTDRGWFDSLRWAIGFEEQAPLYFLLLWVFRQFQDQIWVARLPSVLAVGLSLWLSGRISRCLFPQLHPGWITAALAFNPFMVAIALEARGYAWAVLLSVLLLERFLALYARPLLRRGGRHGLVQAQAQIHPLALDWGRLGYVGLALVALYSHYFLACQIAAQGLVLLGVALGDPLRRRRAIACLGAYCFDSLAILALALPLVQLVSHQIAALGDNMPILDSPSRGAIARAALSKAVFRNLVFLLPSDPVGPTSLAWRLARLGLGAGLLGLAWRRRQEVRFPLGLIWGIHGLTMVFLGLAFSLVSSVEYRHSVVMIGLTYLSTLGLLTLLPRQRRQWWLSLGLAVLLCLNGQSLWQSYHGLAKAGDYARVAQLLQQRVGPGQPVVVFNSEVALALGHYYPQGNSLQGNSSQGNPSHANPSQGNPAGQNLPQGLDRAQDHAQNQAPSPRPTTVIALPESLLSHPPGELPRYRQSALVLQGPGQIEQALAGLGASNAESLPGVGPGGSRLPDPLPNGPLSAERLPSESLPTELWLVTDSQILTAMPAFDRSYQLLESFVQRHYQELERHPFQGTQVRYLRLLSQPEGAIAQPGPGTGEARAVFHSRTASD